MGSFTQNGEGGQWGRLLRSGLLGTQPNADRCEPDESQIVGCKLVVSCRDTSTLLDLVEEPFDQVAYAVPMRANTDRVCPLDLSFRQGKYKNKAGTKTSRVQKAPDDAGA